MRTAFWFEMGKNLPRCSWEKARNHTAKLLDKDKTSDVLTMVCFQALLLHFFASFNHTKLPAWDLFYVKCRKTWRADSKALEELVHSSNTSNSSAGPAWSQELRTPSQLPRRVVGTQVWGSSLSITKVHRSRKLEWKGEPEFEPQYSNRECRPAQA